MKIKDLQIMVTDVRIIRWKTNWENFKSFNNFWEKRIKTKSKMQKWVYEIALLIYRIKTNICKSMKLRKTGTLWQNDTTLPHFSISIETGDAKSLFFFPIKH